MNAIFPKTSRLSKLARQLHDPRFRHSYLSRHVKAFLSAQIRALRREKSQADFGKALGKPQSVVSRLESQEVTVNVQTLLDIANKLDIGLLIRFVDYPTLLKWTKNPLEATVVPERYAQKAVETAALQEDLMDLFMRQPRIETGVPEGPSKSEHRNLQTGTDENAVQLVA